jgi:hypothetical protein
VHRFPGASELGTVVTPDRPGPDDPDFHDSSPEPGLLVFNARLPLDPGALLERFPNLRLAAEPLEWRALPAFRGLAKLRVLI